MLHLYIRAQRHGCRELFYLDVFEGVLFLNNGGSDRVRTDDLLHAMQALSQLSYGPL